MIRKIIIALLILLILPVSMSYAQQLAFPGAEGYGAYSRGGRGGDVYTVTNLNDSGEGSLRHGIKTSDGPRTIVFAVSGLIQLEEELEVKKDYITIAGQTAPGDGICLRDHALSIDASHIIVRYIRSRLGDEAGNKSDAISIFGGHNIIMDHCSASWSVDEVFSCSTEKDGKLDNVTVQWCIISEALKNSIHHKGEHGYGALIRGCYGAKYSYHHNLFAHNASRNPRPGNYDINSADIDPKGLMFDFRNNVIYNWEGSRPGYDGDKKSVCNYNYVGNYGKPGPDSDKKGYAYSAGCKLFKGYYADNYFFGSIPVDQWELVRFGKDWSKKELRKYKRSRPFPSGPFQTQSPLEAYQSVLQGAGASLTRDEVDVRVVKDVKNGTGSLIDHENEVGGWPEYRTFDVKLDSDGDGMPDAWELSGMLDPEDPSDRNEDEDGDGYTNLEEYLNSMSQHGSDEHTDQNQ